MPIISSSPIHDRGYLDIQYRGASLAIPTTPTVFKWDTVAADLSNMYTSSTGVIFLPRSGNYTFLFSYNVKSSASTHSLLSIAEVLIGGVWTVSTYSARQVSVRNGEASQVLYVSTNFFTAGTSIRFPLWCDSSLSIQTEVATAYPTGIIPAARLLITYYPTS